MREMGAGMEGELDTSQVHSEATEADSVGAFVT